MPLKLDLRCVGLKTSFLILLHYNVLSRIVLLQNVASQPDAAQSFYQTYYTDILQHMFSVVTDTSHTAGLTMHATILAYMFTLVETNKITVHLNPVVSTVPLPGANITFVQVQILFQLQCF